METTTIAPPSPSTAPAEPMAAWPPLAHILPHSRPVTPGEKALCGARMMGIDLGFGNVPNVCKRCIELALAMVEGTDGRGVGGPRT